MNFLKKRPWAAALGITVIAITVALAATYPHRLTVGGTEIWRINTDGSTVQQGGAYQIGALRFGNTDTTASVTLPTTSTGNSFSMQVPVYNPTATAIPAGSALVSSGTGAGYVNIAPATIDLTGIIGVAASAIAATSNGWMVTRGGGYAIVLTTGTVAVGDCLITSGTVAGRLGTDNTPTTGADVAVAMTAGVDAGSSILAIMR